MGKILRPLPPEAVWGPPLEWDVGSARDGRAEAAWVAVIFGAFLAIGMIRWDGPTRDAVIFALVAIPFIALVCRFFYVSGSRRWLVAGALWLQKDNVWVSLYELTDVTISAGGGGQVFTLVDSSGRTLSSLNVWQLQRHQLMWDLVYNGMLYSAVYGQLRPAASVQRFFSLPTGPVAPMRSIEDFARIGDGGRPVGAERVGDGDEVNVKRRGANLQFTLLGAMAMFFGLVGLVLIPDPELRPGSLFLIPLSLVLAMWTAMGYYVRYDRGPLSRNKKGELRRVPQTPVIIVSGLLLMLGGAFVLADNAFVGLAIFGGGLAAAIGQMRRALAARRERRAPAGRHAAE